MPPTKPTIRAYTPPATPVHWCCHCGNCANKDGMGHGYCDPLQEAVDAWAPPPPTCPLPTWKEKSHAAK